MSRQALLLGLLVLVLAVLAVGWYTGFSFDLSRFFAAEPDRLSVVCGGTQNTVTWTHHPLANSNSIQRGGPAFLPKNLPDCADYWCWLPTIDFPHQLPTPGNPVSYTDTQPMPGVCHAYRIKYQPILPSNEVFCPPGCNLTPTPTPATPTPTPPPTPTPTPTVTPPPPPTVDIKCTSSGASAGADAPSDGPCQVPSGSSSMLSWTSTNAASCIASGAWSGPKGLQGSEPSIPVTQTLTFIMTCANISGIATDQVVVNVIAPTPTPATPTPVPSPTVDIKCATTDANAAPTDGPCQVTSGSAATLSWTSTNATSCVASNGWSGAKDRQGSESSGALTATRTFVITCVNESGSATDQVVVNVTATPTPTPSGTPTPTATPAALTCAPVSQTVGVNQVASFQSAGGTGSYNWSASGGSPSSATGSGPAFSTVYSTSGNRTVTVTSGGQSANCSVSVQAAATPTPTPTTPALDIQKTARNVSTGGAEAESVNGTPGQTIEFIIRVRSVGTGTVTGVTVRDTLPAGLTYQAGTTTVDASPAADGIVGSGLPLGDMAPGRVIVVRFRAVLAAESFFAVGTTILTNTAFAQGTGVSAQAATNVQNNALVSVTRGSTVTQVPTGPGESALLALVISAIATLLYVGYASSEGFRRREVEGLAGEVRDDRGSGDFKR